MADKNHKVLKNPFGLSSNFNAGRNVQPQEVARKEPEAYRSLKERFRGFANLFKFQRAERQRRRTIQLPVTLEYINIRFLIIFNDAGPFHTRRRFKNDFGLVPVEYKDFNQSILFYIENEIKFKQLIRLIEEFYNSPDDVHPKDTDYSIVTTLKDFSFLTRESISEVDDDQANVLLEVVESLHVYNEVERLKLLLTGLLEEMQNEDSGFQYHFHKESLEIHGVSSARLNSIVDNFDIFSSALPIRKMRISPYEFGTSKLSWDFNCVPSENEVLVGVLDTGIDLIEPLSDILVDGIDITSDDNPNLVHHYHGTRVGTIVALGEKFHKEEGPDLDTPIKLFPIKILARDNGEMNFYKLFQAINQAVDSGVRIFNLSVNNSIKMYNSGNSKYAQMLDELIFERDILFIISTGNMDDSIEAITEEMVAGTNLASLSYPNHFYNPYREDECSVHSCECTNIQTPAESMNAMSVGAIAENYNSTPTSMTPDKKMPAYYTRKNHLDYNRKVNGTRFQKNQRNLNLIKPDVVMAGGDMGSVGSGVQVVDDGSVSFFSRGAGTSYAAPLVANLAALLLSRYSLNMQTIKALLINQSERITNDSLFQPLIDDIKHETAIREHGVGFSGLDQSPSSKISERISSAILHKNVAGHGTINTEGALGSSEKEVTLLIEDSIQINTHKVINVNIPEYLLEYDKSNWIIKVEGTLCYKFLPVGANQLAYNPLHISFNYYKSVSNNDPDSVAEILSNPRHTFYTDMYEEGMSDKEKSTVREKATSIKGGRKKWSEDFFPRASKPFSNVQKHEININVRELEKVDNQISIAIRCTGKEELGPEVDTYLSTTHDFSLALTFTENPNSTLEGDLHASLTISNDLDNCIRVDSDLSLDL